MSEIAIIIRNDNYLLWSSRGWLAPPVARFKTFAIDGREVARAYMSAVCECPGMQKWRATAEAETQITKYV